MSKLRSAAEAVSGIRDGAVIAVNASSGLCCPDEVLEAIGERFADTKSPRALTMMHPIAAGDMYGIKGIDHLAANGLIARIIAGSYRPARPPPSRR